jgi:DNA-binding CsgD family transcriptional regulator
MIGKPASQLALWNHGADRYLKDLAPALTAASRNGGVSHDLDVFSARERDRMAVYAEYMRPMRMRSSLSGWVHAECSVTQCVAVARTGRSAPFLARDVALMRQLQPTISLTLRSLAGVRAAPRERVEGSGEHTWAELSSREREVAHLVGRGLHNQEIAAVCGTSVHTVRNQLASIFRKLDVTTRAELAGLRATHECD